MNGRVAVASMEREIDSESATNVEYLTQKEVAAKFRVTAGTVKAWREAGHLTYLQAPGSARILYPLQGILEFERRFTRQATNIERSKPAAKKEKPEVSTKSQREWRI
jgi:hypothetical protein